VARYGQAFKNRAVAQLLLPGNASLDVVAREIGVGVGTLERWRSDALSRRDRDAPGQRQVDLRPW
jgi:transposase-like protein